MPPFFPNRRNVSPSQNFLAIDSETRYRNSKNLIKPGHPSIFLYGIRCSIFHDTAQQSTRDHRRMLPASQRHSRVSFRPSNARLSAAFPHHLPLTPHSKSKCWSTRAFHRGLPSPSSHSHSHAGKSATVNENRNTISLAEKINKAIYLCEQKSEEWTQPAAPTLFSSVTFLHQMQLSGAKLSSAAQTWSLAMIIQRWPLGLSHRPSSPLGTSTGVHKPPKCRH